MKIMSTYSLKQGASVKEAASRFLAGKAAPPEGVTILGRWQSTDLSCGFTLYETSNPALLYGIATQWGDLLQSHHTIVIEDAEAGPALAKLVQG